VPFSVGKMTVDHGQHDTTQLFVCLFVCLFVYGVLCVGGLFVVIVIVIVCLFVCLFVCLCVCDMCGM
jgi:hypothetical protein